MDKVYTIFFLNDDEPKVIKGKDICDALHREGYPNPATITAAIDFYGEGDIRNRYYFSKAEGCWHKNE